MWALQLEPLKVTSDLVLRFLVVQFETLKKRNDFSFVRGCLVSILKNGLRYHAIIWETESWVSLANLAFLI